MVQYRYIKEFENGGKKTNIFIAAFTTFFARLKLYSEIHLLVRESYIRTQTPLFFFHAKDSMSQNSGIIWASSHVNYPVKMWAVMSLDA